MARKHIVSTKYDNRFPVSGYGNVQLNFDNYDEDIYYYINGGEYHLSKLTFKNLRKKQKVVLRNVKIIFDNVSDYQLVIDFKAETDNSASVVFENVVFENVKNFLVWNSFFKSKVKFYNCTFKLDKANDLDTYSGISGLRSRYDNLFTPEVNILSNLRISPKRGNESGNFYLNVSSGNTDGNFYKDGDEAVSDFDVSRYLYYMMNGINSYFTFPAYMEIAYRINNNEYSLSSFADVVDNYNIFPTIVNSYDETWRDNLGNKGHTNYIKGFLTHYYIPFTFKEWNTRAFIRIDGNFEDFKNAIEDDTLKIIQKYLRNSGVEFVIKNSNFDTDFVEDFSYDSTFEEVRQTNFASALITIGYYFNKTYNSWIANKIRNEGNLINTILEIESNRLKKLELEEVWSRSLFYPGKFKFIGNKYARDKNVDYTVISSNIKDKANNDSPSLYNINTLFINPSSSDMIMSSRDFVYSVPIDLRLIYLFKTPLIQGLSFKENIIKNNTFKEEVSISGLPSYVSSDDFLKLIAISPYPTSTFQATSIHGIDQTNIPSIDTDRPNVDLPYPTVFPFYNMLKRYFNSVIWFTVNDEFNYMNYKYLRYDTGIIQSKPLNSPKIGVDLENNIFKFNSGTNILIDFDNHKKNIDYSIIVPYILGEDSSGTDNLYFYKGSSHIAFIGGQIVYPVIGRFNGVDFNDTLNDIYNTPDTVINNKILPMAFPTYIVYFSIKNNISEIYPVLENTIDFNTILSKIEDWVTDPINLDEVKVHSGIQTDYVVKIFSTGFVFPLSSIIASSLETIPYNGYYDARLLDAGVDGNSVKVNLLYSQIWQSVPEVDYDAYFVSSSIEEMRYQVGSGVFGSTIGNYDADSYNIIWDAILDNTAEFSSLNNSSVERLYFMALQNMYCDSSNLNGSTIEFSDITNKEWNSRNIKFDVIFTKYVDLVSNLFVNYNTGVLINLKYVQNNSDLNGYTIIRTIQNIYVGFPFTGYFKTYLVPLIDDIIGINSNVVLDFYKYPYNFKQVAGELDFERYISPIFGLFKIIGKEYILSNPIQDGYAFSGYELTSNPSHGDVSIEFVDYRND